MTEAPYHQLTIDVPEADAQLVAGALESFGAPAPQSVTARRMGKSVPWRIEAIFTEAVDEGALAQFLIAILLDDTPKETAFELHYTLEPLAEEDWVALSQSQLPPIRTKRFYVRGTHVPLPADLGTRHVLTIEAGLAFGTGHHASTHACLLALEELTTHSPPPGPLPHGEGGTQFRGAWPRRILDLGTGTGLLAIAAVKLWPSARAFASDIDPVAVEVARENCHLNETPAIRCVTAPGFNHAELAGSYDLVLANILARPLKILARDIAAHTAPGGRLILSGILDEQAADIAACYGRAGFRLVRRRDLEGWSALTLARA